MTDKDREPKAPPPRSNCDDLTEAALDAEQMISRMQDIVTEAIQPTGDPEQGLNELIEELDPAPEGAALREALGMDKHGTRDLPKGRARKARAKTGTADPEEKPPEHRTWTTGP